MAANSTKLQNLSKDELLKYIESLSEQLSRYEIRFRGEFISTSEKNRVSLCRSPQRCFVT